MPTDLEKSKALGRAFFSRLPPMNESTHIETDRAWYTARPLGQMDCQRIPMKEVYQACKRMRVAAATGVDDILVGVVQNGFKVLSPVLTRISLRLLI